MKNVPNHQPAIVYLDGILLKFSSLMVFTRQVWCEKTHHFWNIGQGKDRGKIQVVQAYSKQGPQDGVQSIGSLGGGLRSNKKGVDWQI